MSRTVKVPDETGSGVLSDLRSEDAAALSRPEFALDPGFESEGESFAHEDNDFWSESDDSFLSERDSFLSEGDGGALIPMGVEAVQPPDTGRGFLADRVRAKSFGPVKAYLLPLVVTVVAVMAVERVSQLKGMPTAAPMEGATAVATEPPTAATPSATVTVASVPAAPGVTAAQPDGRRTGAARVASLPSATAERPIATGLKPQAALNSPAALVEGPPISAPALLGIAAKAPAIEMRAPDMPAVLMTDAAAVPAPITPAAVDVETVDKAAIDRVLGTYQQSYSALDAAMVSTIWRGLDTRGLQRAFDGLDSQRMSFEHCDVTIDDDKASASCTGVLDYVRKIGQANPLQKRLSWHFDLERSDDRWLISKVNAR